MFGTNKKNRNMPGGYDSAERQCLLLSKSSKLRTAERDGQIVVEHFNSFDGWRRVENYYQAQGLCLTFGGKCRNFFEENAPELLQSPQKPEEK